MILLLMAVTLALQDDAAATEALATFDAAFPKAKDPEGRAALVNPLGAAAVQHEKVVSKLNNLMHHADKPVRIAAVQALKAYSSNSSAALKKSATKALIDGMGMAVNTKDPDVKEIIVGALGQLQDDLAIAPLKTALDDKIFRVASAAVSAATAFKSKDLIEPLISQLKECEKTQKAAGNPTLKGKKPTSAKKDPNDPEELKLDRAINLLLPIKSSLETLTGQTYPNGDEWDKWWTKARPNFVIKRD
jgi:HEAT repeat protein